LDLAGKDVRLGHGEPAALVQRSRLVAATGGQIALEAALDHMPEKGWLLPSQDRGAAKKLRFVYLPRAFLGQPAALRP